MIARVTFALVGLLLLAGCSGGSDPGAAAQGNQFGILARLASSGLKAPAPLPTVNRAVIDRLKVPSLEVTRERTKQKAYVIPVATRTDGTPGRITVWQGVDGGQVILRDGVLAGTRGIGNDLASAQIEGTRRAVRNIAPGAATRVHYVRNDLNGQDVLRLSCRIERQGPETVTIYDRGYRTLRLRETCTGAPATVVNDYWIEPGDGTVRLSRQWVGPKVGYLHLRLLKK